MKAVVLTISVALCLSFLTLFLGVQQGRIVAQKQKEYNTKSLEHCKNYGFSDFEWRPCAGGTIYTKYCFYCADKNGQLFPVASPK